MKKYFVLILGGLYFLSGCGSGASAPPPPTMSLAPAGLNFGVSVIGSGTAPQAETLTNTGSSDLAISGVTIGGTNAADFTLSNTCGASLAAAPASSPSSRYAAGRSLSSRLQTTCVEADPQDDLPQRNRFHAKCQELLFCRLPVPR